LTAARAGAHNPATASVRSFSFSLRLLGTGLVLLGAWPARAEPAGAPAAPPAAEPAPGPAAAPPPPATPPPPTAAPPATPSAPTAAPPVPAAPAATAPASPPPRTAPPPDPEVEEHVAQGRRLYLLGRYQEAIAEYRRAYELRADPKFLLDTAEAYRQLGATDQALFYYDRYLAAAPHAADREIVEDRVTELELARAPAPAPGPLAPAPAAAKPRPAPLWKRWWLWTAVGVALSAGVTAAALSNRSTSPPVPATDLGDRRFF
jgi:hypothetical protein